MRLKGHRSGKVLEERRWGDPSLIENPACDEKTGSGPHDRSRVWGETRLRIASKNSYIDSSRTEDLKQNVKPAHS